MTCKDCIHEEPCVEYGNILDPLGGGVICDSFKNKADFAEVVRCKDCKHYYLYDEFDRNTGNIYMCHECNLLHRSLGDNDFCSCGERKDKVN